MKSVLVFAACFVTLISSYPASDKSSPSDPDFNPFADREPVVDTGYFDSYYPSFLDSFNKRIQDIISSLRQSVTGDSMGLNSSFGDLGKGETKTYTKIVGNHKVEVNETEYKKDTDFGTSHVKISYVNVRPLHPDTIDEPNGTTEADTEPINKPADRDRESLESVENEIIPNNIDEASNMDIETLDVIIKSSKNNNNNNEPEFGEEFPSIPYKQLTDSEVEDLNNDIEMSSRDFPNAEPIRDLSNDIRVNDIMLADGALPNPHAEFIF